MYFPLIMVKETKLRIQNKAATFYKKVKTVENTGMKQQSAATHTLTNGL